MSKTFNKIYRKVLLDTREEILQKISVLEDKYELFERSDPRQAALFAELSQLKLLLKSNKEDYYNNLPEIIFSECPYSEKQLKGSFDPVSMDGLWWMEFTRNPNEWTIRPDTFRLLRGAVNFCDLKPKGGRYDALIGPGVPYVIPRILQLPGMKMVISQIKMENGCIVYPLAYFSSETQSSGQLTSTWLEKDQYYFHDAEGKSSWRVANDAWDFDIGPWIEHGKVHWIKPGETKLAPVSTNPHDCPYVNLTGIRLPQIINETGFFTDSLPNPNADDDFSD